MLYSETALPTELLLSPEEKKDFAQKLLLLANPPHRPDPILELKNITDNTVYLSYPWMSQSQEEAFRYLLDKDIFELRK